MRQGQLPAHTPRGHSLSEVKVRDQYLRGLKVYGVPVGSPAYIQHALRETAGEIKARDQEEELRSTECYTNKYLFVWETDAESTAVLKELFLHLHLQSLFSNLDVCLGVLPSQPLLLPYQLHGHRGVYDALHGLWLGVHWRVSIPHHFLEPSIHGLEVEGLEHVVAVGRLQANPASFIV
jgi:hypothetical protein